jgi:glycosyltransferase involved in cell wall biosynthesis
MKKILWLSNFRFSKDANRSTGTWLEAMGIAIARTNECQLFNITHGKVKKTEQADCGPIRQWVVPYAPSHMDGLPRREIVSDIQRIVAELRPDLIHVWGTENYWGLLTARNLLPFPSLLEIQGLKYAIAPKMLGELTFFEILRCIGLKECIRPSYSIIAGQAQFKRATLFENEIIKGHSCIAVPSEWAKAHVEFVNPTCRLFPTRMMLRTEFTDSKPWQLCADHPPTLFTSSSGSVPYKGLHVLLRAVFLLKKEFPKIRLNVGGAHIQKGFRRSGYARWLLREVQSLGISDNVRFLGPLAANEIVEQLHQTSVSVIPSFIESYSVALAESLAVGVPTVASYAGAMPEFAVDGVSALFFPSGDETMCARRIRKILLSPSVAVELSLNARQVGLLRYNPPAVLNRQLEIYNEVMGGGAS